LKTLFVVVKNGRVWSLVGTENWVDGEITLKGCLGFHFWFMIISYFAEE
jgi:hypothetical protein